GRMGLVSGSDRGCLSRTLSPARYAQKIRSSHLSFCRMSSAAFAFIAILTLAAAIAAASLSKLIHAALSLAVAFVGVAAFYFLLGAEFVGLVQVFIYVGAVAVLIVFTILLTRRDAVAPEHFNWAGIVVALAVFCVRICAVSFVTP